jgi:3-keto-L-gulonate-6-phosphate decarboxylase
LIFFIIFIGLIIFTSKKRKNSMSVLGKFSQMSSIVKTAKQQELSGKSKEEISAEVQQELQQLINFGVNEPVMPTDSTASQQFIEMAPTEIKMSQINNSIASQTVFAGSNVFSQLFSSSRTIKQLSRKKRYLQVALNGTLQEAHNVISQLPRSEKIIIEAGTPLIKIEGDRVVRDLRYAMPDAYIVADIKTVDLARREVEYFAAAGANAVTCLGVAPIETIEEFIVACKDNSVDSMIDMMNVENPLLILKKIKSIPKVVILHRGVDETESSKGKMLPYYQINQIKGMSNVMVAVAGGDTPKEVQSAVFNGADIVVVWKDFAGGGGVRKLAESFLKDVK